MRAVGIKTLKAKLSEYVRLAKSGETVLVTDRDEVVAELRPAKRQALPPSELEDALQDLADKGEATLHSAEIKGWPGPAPVGHLAGKSSQEILDELRKDL